MAKCLNNCCYDRIKLLHNLSSCLWFIGRHAEENAKQSEHKKLQDLLSSLEKDLEKHIKALHDLDCGC